MTHIDHPLTFDNRRRSAQATDQEYVRDLIEQVLFTTPGERINRPDFGSDLLQLVFEPNSVELAATVRFLTQGALQLWLGDLIVVESVEVTADDAILSVSVQYTVRLTQERQLAEFQRSVP